MADEGPLSRAVLEPLYKMPKPSAVGLSLNKMSVFPSERGPDLFP